MRRRGGGEKKKMYIYIYFIIKNNEIERLMFNILIILVRVFFN